MNFCGGHERSISMAGLRTTLPPNIELIPGPGCPVCICPEEDIYQADRKRLFGCQLLQIVFTQTLC
jgi:hydrogenase expression/formation protein HypD